jgi:four helix bundle protein
MQKINNYRDLRIWQQAINLAPAVYELLKKFPKEENYALAGQIRRAAVSVPANIAEGQARQHTKEFLQHLCIAKGSIAELDTLLIVAEKLGYLKRQDLEEVEAKMIDLRMPLQGLINRLQSKL